MPRDFWKWDLAPILSFKEMKMKLIKNFLSDESGMETLEYALIAGLIAIVAIFVYNSSWKTNLFDRLTTASTTS
jgi:Flp pilus assembly pilin Flp